VSGDDSPPFTLSAPLERIVIETGPRVEPAFEDLVDEVMRRQ